MTSTVERLRQLAPHWAVILVIVFVSFTLIENTVGPLELWQSLVVVAVIAFGYPIVVRSLGVAPEIWQHD